MLLESSLSKPIALECDVFLLTLGLSQGCFDLTMTNKIITLTSNSPHFLLCCLSVEAKAECKYSENLSYILHGQKTVYSSKTDYTTPWKHRVGPKMVSQVPGHQSMYLDNRDVTSAFWQLTSTARRRGPILKEHL